jgi:hypothetical protein
MAKNTKSSYRHGAVKKRTQFLNPANGNYMKRDEKGRFISGKKDSPYKGIRIKIKSNKSKKSRRKKN